MFKVNLLTNKRDDSRAGYATSYRTYMALLTVHVDRHLRPVQYNNLVQ